MVHFHCDEFPQASPSEAKFHIIPVPFEDSVSYKGGTASGPQAILEASAQLETISEGNGEPGNFGIYTKEAISCVYEKSPCEVFSRISLSMEESFNVGAIPLLLGGEHSITNGAINCISKLFTQGEVGIIQFDAHMDLRDAYQGNYYSHASVMKRALEAHIPLFQIGIRNYSSEEVQVRAFHQIPHYDASSFFSKGDSVCSIPKDFPKKVYISFDVDCFDASLMSATGTPEPGGLFWWDVISLLAEIRKERQIVGADVVELAPMEGAHHCNYTAAKLVYALMGFSSTNSNFSS